MADLPLGFSWKRLCLLLERRKASIFQTGMSIFFTFFPFDQNNMKGGRKMKKSNLRLLTMMLVLAMSLTQLAFAEESTVVMVSGEGIEEALTFTLEDLMAVPEEGQVDEEYIYNSKGGEKSVIVKGVSLSYVLDEMAGIDLEEGMVEFTAADAWPIDPQPLSDVMDEALKFVMAYEVDGEAIDNDDDPETDEIVVYRKVKEEGEFNTVYKLVVDIKVTAAEPAVEEPVVEEPVEEEPAEEMPAIEFTDITEEYAYAEAAIMAMAEKGIINGMGDGIYAPEKEFTRAQFAKIMVESLGYEMGEYDGSFSDVTAEAWYAPYVQAAVDNGLFTGYTDGTFMPDKVINRQEIAAVAGRGAVMGGVVDQAKLEKFVMEKSNFMDKESVPEWAANEVAWLEEQGVFAEVAGENFEPVKVVNRAEAAVIVYNTLFAE